MKNIIPYLFSGVFLFCSPVQAAVHAEEILNPGMTENLREKMLRNLDDPRVQKEMGRLGVQKSEVQARLAAMSDRELNQVSKQTMQQAGGDNIVISATALIIILLLIIIIA